MNSYVPCTVCSKWNTDWHFVCSIIMRTQRGKKEVVIVITVLSEPHPLEGTVYKRVGSFIRCCK